MDKVGEQACELYNLQEGPDNCGPSEGICGKYMGTYYFLREVVGSDLRKEDFEEYINLVSFKYLLSNFLRPH